jgi:hypothetical protein
MLNIFGFALCSGLAANVNDLWRLAELDPRNSQVSNHSWSEVFFDNQFHYLDSNLHTLILKRDNKTIAGEVDLVRDHDLIRRNHVTGIQHPQDRSMSERMASAHIHTGDRPKGNRGGHINDKMHYMLRSGEEIEWRWDHQGLYFTTNPKKALSRWGPGAEYLLANGNLRYQPDLKEDSSLNGIEYVENMAVSPKGLQVVTPGVTANVIWKIELPYLLMKSSLNLDWFNKQGATLKIYWSVDKTNWHVLDSNTETTQPLHVEVTELSDPDRPDYTMYYRVEILSSPDGIAPALTQASFLTIFQHAYLTLPELRLGNNSVQYSDQSEEPSQVEVTHAWVERNSWAPPPQVEISESPVEGLYESGQPEFAWQAPDDSLIEDYHIQVSEYQDMRWPLSPTFDRLVSKTNYGGQTGWKPESNGLLNPSQDYYWRVRAKNTKGIWGQWSEVKEFQVSMPGTPTDLELTIKERMVYLSWKKPSKGSTPTLYKIYGSNEKGFPANDEHYIRYIGQGYCSSAEQCYWDRASNFEQQVAPNYFNSTSNTSIQIVGQNLKLNNANKTFYRVVAVDKNGIESGASDYIEVPSPFIFSIPGKATSGENYNYEIKSTVSIGHLTWPDGGREPAFWRTKNLRCELLEAPPWLKISPSVGADDEHYADETEKAEDMYELARNDIFHTEDFGNEKAALCTLTGTPSDKYLEESNKVVIKIIDQNNESTTTQTFQLGSDNSF